MHDFVGDPADLLWRRPRKTMRMPRSETGSVHWRESFAAGGAQAEERTTTQALDGFVPKDQSLWS